MTVFVGLLRSNLVVYRISYDIATNHLGVLVVIHHREIKLGVGY